LAASAHEPSAWSEDASSDSTWLAQAFAPQFDPVRVVDDPVQDGVGQRRVADDLVPAVDLQLLVMISEPAL